MHSLWVYISLHDQQTVGKQLIDIIATVLKGYRSRKLRLTCKGKEQGHDRSQQGERFSTALHKELDLSSHFL